MHDIPGRRLTGLESVRHRSIDEATAAVKREEHEEAENISKHGGSTQDHADGIVAEKVPRDHSQVMPDTLLIAH